MTTRRQVSGGSDGPPRPRRGSATGSDGPAAPNAVEARGARTHHHARDVRDRDEEAVDAATAERLSDGVRRDLHGEYAPDPYPDDQDPAETGEDVIEHHRRLADRLEHQPDVPRADE